ncbi:GNAT family N-acetyltransferase [Betaproteobacteria bacterium PRO7]|jgi:N-acetylglutamate synthase-like GNAT family acetyltransferase|nr:GNAT family N-acetyltransferase [Betaproteobacteria bacterium PRO7]
MPTPAELAVRPARAADWPAVAALLERAGLPLAGAREHLSTFLLAWRGDALIACVGAELYGSDALLRSVAVAPQAQRTGVGSALVAQALAIARSRGVRSAYLLTTTAAPFFERLGFRSIDASKVPAAVRTSVEFNGVCPASATVMHRAVQDAASADAATDALPIAVIGAGPVGLAALAHLLERGLDAVVLEAGAAVGANLLDYGHVQLFSPWRYNVDAAIARRLQAAGWIAPPGDELPLARAIVERYLRPYAQLPDVAPRVLLQRRVVSIARAGFDKVKTDGRERAPFALRIAHAGRIEEVRVRAVIDASGTWTQPNPLGASGLPAIGEEEARDRIAYGIPDVLGAERERYAGRRVLVVGSGHSAANALLALAELAPEAPGTAIVWAIRGENLARVFGGGAADALPARGALGLRLKRLQESGTLEVVRGFRTIALSRDGDRLTVHGLNPRGERVAIDGVDRIVAATGQRPDLSLASELRLKLDPWLESTEALGPLIDPNVHSCGTVRPHGHRELAHPEPGFYTIGVKSYGRAPTFLMATGHEQARSVAAALAGDLEAADRVELDLPKTGVCGVSFAADEAETPAAACGPRCAPAPQPSIRIPVKAATACCG